WVLACVTPASAETTLRMVSHADLKILDPIWTTANITRNHGYLIYDVLFATDADFKVQPQMAEKVDISADKLSYTITLRDGLEWHDGTPVTAEDCIASIRRWGARDGFGQLLLRSTAALKPIDPKSLVLVLKEPFGLMLEAPGEIDLIESPPTDLLPLLKGSKGVALYGWNVQGGQALMRFNHLQPPFDNPKVRQAAMLALAQEDFLRAQYGDPELYRTCNAPFI